MISEGLTACQGTSSGAVPREAGGVVCGGKDGVSVLHCRDGDPTYDTRKY